MIGTRKDKMRKTRVGENEKGSREEQNREWRRSSDFRKLRIQQKRT